MPARDALSGDDARGRDGSRSSAVPADGGHPAARSGCAQGMQLGFARDVCDMPVQTRAADSSDDSASVVRTKSVSSVSSVNSSSSIEAAPFRAPPLGNVRNNSGRLSPARAESAPCDPSPLPAVPLYAPLSATSYDYSLAAPAAAPPAEDPPPVQQPPARPLSGASSRTKHLPKPTSGAWIYRNGPGISGNARHSPMLRAAGLSDAGTQHADAESETRAAAGDARTAEGDARSGEDDARSEDAARSEDEDRVLVTSPATNAPLVVSKGHSLRPSSRASYKTSASHAQQGKTHSPVRAPGARADSAEARRSTESVATPRMHATELSMPVPHTYLPHAQQLTPAEIIRMEAQAGIARPPSTPSVPVPGLLVEPADGMWAGDEAADACSDTRGTRVSQRSSGSTLMARSPPSRPPTWYREARNSGERQSPRKTGASDSPSSDSTQRPGSQRGGPAPLGASTLASDSTSTLTLPAWSGGASPANGAPPCADGGVAAMLPREPPLRGERDKALPATPPPPGSATEQAARMRRSPSDYLFGGILGEGSYSTVVRAWDIRDVPEAQRQEQRSAMQAAAGHGVERAPLLANGEPAPVYAVKVLDKVHILKEKKQKYVRVEKEALSLLLHSRGIVTLYHTFQDRESLYFVLQLAPHGELLSYVQRLGSLDLVSGRFYAAQLADAIDTIHRAGVVHRDIKPENVLLDEGMRVVVTDFGSAKIVGRPTRRSSSERIAEEDVARLGTAGSFVGTAEYASPELLSDKIVGMPADWWAFGCVVFQLIAGVTPFKGANEYQTFQHIIHRKLAFPPAFPADAVDLVEHLLVADPAQRFDARAVKTSAFFAGTDFATLWTDTPPPMQPGAVRRRRSHDRSLSQGMNDLEMSFDALHSSVHTDDGARDRDPSVPTDDRSTSSAHADCESDRSSTSDRSGGAQPWTSSRRVLRRRPSAAQHHHVSAHAPPTASVADTFQGLLLPAEFIVYSSPIILRKTGAGAMFSKRCQLLLTSFPRLLCVRENSKMLKVLSEVILRTPPDDAHAPAGTPPPHGAHVKRSDSRRSTTSRRGHTPSLRSQASFSSLSMPKFPRGLVKRPSTRSAPGDAPADSAPDSDPADSTTAAPQYGNWLVDVEARPPRGFVVQTPTRQHLYEDPAGDQAYWVQCILEAEQQYAATGGAQEVVQH
ncbi:non-specific serine/threonine protein kinase [Malassezia sp. CBS 17886]|nr:non-specific serine/threonine protein kinase [Malassezia sp. CBS 17886]